MPAVAAFLHLLIDLLVVRDLDAIASGSLIMQT